MPAAQIRLRYKSGEFAEDVRSLGEFVNVTPPGVKETFPDARFAQMVEDELLIRVAVDETARGLHLPLDNQNFVHQTMPA